MTLAHGDTPIRRGRASRTALLGILAAGSGDSVFAEAAQPLSRVVPFVVMMLMSGALILELTDQARRGVHRWTGTDTAITAVLTGYAALLGVAAAYRVDTAAAGFAVLYVVLAGCFLRVRRKILSCP